MKVTIRKSNRPEKKWMAQFENGRVVHFGATGYQDYTQHKDPERMRRYKLRHGGGREKHGKSGMYTAGFWAMWLLWNKPSLQASARDMEKRFGLKISFSRGGSSTKTRQRTSRKMRMRKSRSGKMKALMSKVADPDVMQNILSFLTPPQVAAMGATGMAERNVALMMLNKESREYKAEYKMFYDRNSIRGYLDLTRFEDMVRYIHLQDDDNTIGVEIMHLSNYTKLTTPEGRRVIPPGVKTLVFKEPRGIMRNVVGVPEMERYFYPSYDKLGHVKMGDIPDGVVNIIGLSRMIEPGALPPSVRLVEFGDISFRISMDMFPPSIERIVLTINSLSGSDYLDEMPGEFTSKIRIFTYGGYVNPYDNEWEGKEFGYDSYIKPRGEFEPEWDESEDEDLLSIEDAREVLREQDREFYGY